ncbi:hypothetical protein TGMAS_464996 [Toxoplasma gondii MAS]|uniref:Uncharacterized protein n=1 Tax=Toxoplasma gondii MAS TaxID=943118 RepID=A0A086QDR3_TOXGO|nr:hypothetical protein TGMAS_464996 [Toxoplasma gondii MAS]
MLFQYCVQTSESPELQDFPAFLPAGGGCLVGRWRLCERLIVPVFHQFALLHLFSILRPERCSYKRVFSVREAVCVIICHLDTHPALCWRAFSTVDFLCLLSSSPVARGRMLHFCFL